MLVRVLQRLDGTEGVGAVRRVVQQMMMAKADSSRHVTFTPALYGSVFIHATLRPL